MSNLNSQQILRGHCLGPQKEGQTGNPHTAVALYVVPNHLKTQPMAGVSIHMDSPHEDSQTTGAPRNIGGATRVARNSQRGSVNKPAGNLAKYKDKCSLITKNHLVLEIASQCKIDFINNSPPVQTSPNVNFISLNKSPVSLMQNYLNSYHKET